jgi:hypothetical protein
MRIVVDVDIMPDGRVVAEHVFHTEATSWNTTSHEDALRGLTHPLHVIRDIKRGVYPTNNHGWDIISKHPNYAGKTRLEVLHEEVIRLDDKDAREILGV